MYKLNTTIDNETKKTKNGPFFIAESHAITYHNIHHDPICNVKSKKNDKFDQRIKLKRENFENMMIKEKLGCMFLY